jgi:hypothetical protein
LPRPPARHPPTVMPEQTPLPVDSPRFVPPLEATTPSLPADQPPEVPAPIVRRAPRMPAPEEGPPEPAAPVLAPAPAPPRLPERRQAPVAPVTAEAPRAVVVRPAPTEQPAVMMLPRQLRAAQFAPAPEPPALAPPLQTDRPTPALERDQQPAVPLSTPLRPATPTRAPEMGAEGAREQRVTVRIGTIEVRAPARQPVADQVAAPPPPPPAPVGFAAYASLRTYAPWGLWDRP